jgi:hypothetical protein
MMRVMLARCSLLLAALSLAACGSSHSASPDGATASDAGALSDAAVGLDAGGDGGTSAGLTGAACMADAECAGGTCIPDWPDGYCTSIGCDLEDPLGACMGALGDGLCVDGSQGEGTPFGLCLDVCRPSAPDCRDGYDCVEVSLGVGLCFPAAGSGPVGAPCVDNTECASRFCLPESEGFPGGYCLGVGCDVSAPVDSCAPAGGDGRCVDVGTPAMPNPLCFDACAPGAADCREGYDCVDSGGGVGVCVPAAVCGNGAVEQGEECDPPDGSVCGTDCVGLGTAPVGAACATAADCAGNYCAPESDGFPGGVCTQVGCDLAAPETSCLEFGGDGLCIDVGDGVTACIDRCDPARPDCREGYDCTIVAPGVGVCVASPAAAAPTGSPCSTGTDCAGGACLAASDGYPDGYCSSTGCDLASPDASCASAGGDATCVDVGGVATCLDRCGGPGAGACRVGYTCTMRGVGVRVCLP